MIVVHRWVADGSPGQDVVAVVSFDEQPKFGYGVGLPRGGEWIELFNTDDYDGFPNPRPIGNGGSVYADGPPLDGFAQSAAITDPAKRRALSSGRVLVTRVPQDLRVMTSEPFVA